MSELKRRWISGKDLLENGIMSRGELVELVLSERLTAYNDEYQIYLVTINDEPVDDEPVDERKTNPTVTVYIDKDENIFDVPSEIILRKTNANKIRIIKEDFECFDLGCEYFEDDNFFEIVLDSTFNIYNDDIIIDDIFNSKFYIKDIIKIFPCLDDIRTSCLVENAEKHISLITRTEKATATRKEKNYKKLLAALLEKCAINPIARNAVSTIKTEIDKIGFGLDEDTIRKYLKEIQTFIDKEKPK